MYPRGSVTICGNLCIHGTLLETGVNYKFLVRRIGKTKIQKLLRLYLEIQLFLWLNCGQAWRDNFVVKLSVLLDFSYFCRCFRLKKRAS